MPFPEKTQYFVHLCFHSTLQLINYISRDLQKLLKYFSGTAIVAFFRIPLALIRVSLATVFPKNIVLYLKDLKLSVFSIL